MLVLRRKTEFVRLMKFRFPAAFMRREFSLYDIVKRQIIRTFAPSNRSG
jgi:hypothetical protein